MRGGVLYDINAVNLLALIGNTQQFRIDSMGAIKRAQLIHAAIEAANKHAHLVHDKAGEAGLSVQQFQKIFLGDACQAGFFYRLDIG